MMTLYVSELTQEALAQAVIDAQAHLKQEEGQHYSAEVLRQALIFWLESSIEQLVEDAMFHLFQGDRLYAFNRNVFSNRLHQLQKSLLPEVLPLPPLAA